MSSNRRSARWRRSTARSRRRGPRYWQQEAAAIEDGGHRFHRPPLEAEQQLDMFGQRSGITIRMVIRVICGVGTAVLVVAARAQSRSGRVESYSLPHDQLQRAIEYARARHTLYFVGTAWGFVILGLVLALHLA